MAKAPISATPENPFADDLLKRAPVVNLLREVIAGTDEPISVGLAAPWGSGKSSVINLLVADLLRRKEPWVICKFDAWANEDIQDPILGITEELTESLKKLSAPLTQRIRGSLKRMAAGIADITVIGLGAGAAILDHSSPEQSVTAGIVIGTSAVVGGARKFARRATERRASDVKALRENYRNTIRAAVHTVREFYGASRRSDVFDDSRDCSPGI